MLKHARLNRHSIPTAPRSWLSRRPGECAFPVAGEGLDMTCCCNPCGARTYCVGHDALTKARKVKSPKDFEQDIILFLEGLS